MPALCLYRWLWSITLPDRHISWVSLTSQTLSVPQCQSLSEHVTHVYSRVEFHGHHLNHYQWLSHTYLSDLIMSWLVYFNLLRHLAVRKHRQKSSGVVAPSFAISMTYFPRGVSYVGTPRYGCHGEFVNSPIVGTPSIDRRRGGGGSYELNEPPLNPPLNARRRLS